MVKMDKKTIVWLENLLLRSRKIALGYFQKSIKVSRKADRSPVTLADKEIEKFLRKEIAKKFPDNGILGEETGFSGKNKKTYWVIDPIDGTRAFSRGLPSWGILIAKVENRKVVVGACDFPVIQTSIIAVRGKGAYEKVGNKKTKFKNAKPINFLKDAVLFHGGASFFLSSNYAKPFQKVMKQCYLERAYGDCFAYLWVLRGQADLVLEKGVKEWDMAPFSIFASETGRVLVDFKGVSNFKGPNTIFGSPKLVKQVVSSFKK